MLKISKTKKILYNPTSVHFKTPSLLYWVALSTFQRVLRLAVYICIKLPHRHTLIQCVSRAISIAMSLENIVTFRIRFRVVSHFVPV